MEYDLKKHRKKFLDIMEVEDHVEREKLLIELKKEYLKAKPEMQEYQDSIDNILDKCVTQDDRFQAIGMMLAGKMDELHTALVTLQKITLDEELEN